MTLNPKGLDKGTSGWATALVFNKLNKDVTEMIMK